MLRTSLRHNDFRPDPVRTAAVRDRLHHEATIAAVRGVSALYVASFLDSPRPPSAHPRVLGEVAVAPRLETIRGLLMSDSPVDGLGPSAPSESLVAATTNVITAAASTRPALASAAIAGELLHALRQTVVDADDASLLAELIERVTAADFAAYAHSLAWLGLDPRQVERSTPHGVVQAAQILLPRWQHLMSDIEQPVRVVLDDYDSYVRHGCRVVAVAPDEHWTLY